MTPWAQRLNRHAPTWVGALWLHVDFEAHLREFYLRRCGFRSNSAGLLGLTAEPGRPSASS